MWPRGHIDSLLPRNKMGCKVFLSLYSCQLLLYLEHTPIELCSFLRHCDESADSMIGTLMKVTEKGWSRYRCFPKDISKSNYTCLSSDVHVFNI